MAEKVLLVLSTFPELKTARRVARQLVEEKHAACANLLPSIASIYWWEGKVEQADEAIVFFKTTRARFEAFQAALRRLHPYDVPEIVALPIERGLPEYLRWVAEHCTA